ncbi:TNF receptor-associated factor 2 [Lingula anatina]|uniref:TNF receptor-associated factor 2 n=1 Tax=Lingula anatina TaxID=7574 RepID=A0A1S3JPB1_LINAN|nr:TNF receptor-associated factor 2 [Lingula anatina]|eukprot:XP_013412198.1 TNF receptor-associated factor 2 [Lingula anatina]
MEQKFTISSLTECLVNLASTTVAILTVSVSYALGSRPISCCCVKRYADAFLRSSTAHRTWYTRINTLGELYQNVSDIVEAHSRQSERQRGTVIIVNGHDCRDEVVSVGTEEMPRTAFIDQLVKTLMIGRTSGAIWIIFAICHGHHGVEQRATEPKDLASKDIIVTLNETDDSDEKPYSVRCLEDDVGLGWSQMDQEQQQENHENQESFVEAAHGFEIIATDKAGGTITRTTTNTKNGSGSPRGYSFDLFPEADLIQKYLCSFCDLVLRRPVQSHCGHRYCADCFEYVISLDDPVCKPCEDDGDKVYITQSKQFPDVAIRRELERKLIVVCKNQGCEWKGKFGNYVEDHENSCPFRVSSCPNNCGQQLPWNQVDKHLKDKCPLRTVKCRYCPRSFIANRNKILRHQRTNCPKDKMVCQYGCQNKFSVNQAHQHNEENVLKHLDFMRERVRSLLEETEQKQHDRYDRNMGNLKRRLSSLQRDVDNLESQTQEVNTRVDSLTSKKKDQEATVSESVRKDLEALKLREGVMESKSGTFEGIIAVLNREIEKCASLLEEYDRQMRLDREALTNAERKCKSFERALALRDVSMAEQDLRIQALETASYDGVMVWKIADFSKKHHDAITGRLTSFYSPAFYTDPHGYKMCCRIYLNGDGMGKGSHISLFFVVMRGYYDALLAWPFKQKVTLMILDQSNREHVVEAFRPDSASSSFKKPTSDMNIASGCPLFLSLERLGGSNTAYVKDNAMFVKVVVDCTNI